MSNHMPESGRSFWLTVRKGPQAGSVYPLRGHTFTIGRNADNYIVIDDAMISRHHARLTWQGSSYVLEDLGSANGTWINNARLASPALLRPGDVIGLGQNVLLTFSDRPQYDERAAAGQVVPYAAGAAAMAAQPYYAPAGGSKPGRRMSGGTAFALGVTLAAVAVAAVVVILLLLRQPSAPPVAAATATQTATLTEAPTYTAYPTYTPLPTNTPLPTDPPTDLPTYTPYPTYTPIPTLPPTYTPYPTYTPIPTLPPTYTPYPTYTPLPTQKPPPKPQPTTAPQPTNTSRPPVAPYTVAVTKVEPEPWGRPSSDGCSPPYNDRDPVKRFTVEVALTNQSNRTIPDGWYPSFYTANGAVTISCFWDYTVGDIAVSPGETTYVTFVTHTELNDWVSAMVFDELGYEKAVCFNAAGQVVACR